MWFSACCCRNSACELGSHSLIASKNCLLFIYSLVSFFLRLNSFLFYLLHNFWILNSKRNTKKFNKLMEPMFTRLHFFFGNRNTFELLGINLFDFVSREAAYFTLFSFSSWCTIGLKEQQQKNAKQPQQIAYRLIAPQSTYLKYIYVCFHIASFDSFSTLFKQ